MKQTRKNPLSLQKNKAALYVRVSTRYQVDKDSLPFQKKKLTEYLSVIGITEYEIFEDDGYSAKNTKRPEYQRMMSGVRRGDFSHVIVWKLDRISRNLLDFTDMYAELKGCNVTFISMNEQFDTSSAIGGAMLKIVLIFAELEREMTSERVTGIMLDRAESGLWNGGHIPFGYKIDRSEENPFPRPDWGGEAEIVKLIFDMYEKTHSAVKVQRYLYKNKIQGKNGGQWTSKMIHDMIRNPFHIGTYRYNYREPARGLVKPHDQWIIRPHNHEGIISEEQFAHVNEIMDQNAETHNTAELRKREHVHTFSGILRCASCGGGFIASKDKQRENGWQPSVYRCTRQAHTLDCTPKTISEAILGPFVLNYAANMIRIQKNFQKITNLTQMEKELLRGNEFEYIIGIEEYGLQEMYDALLIGGQKDHFTPELSHSISNVRTADDETAILKAERSKLEKALDRLMDLYLYDPDGMSAKEMSEKKRELKEQIVNIDNRIAEMNSPASDDTALEFIRKASAFLVSHHMAGKKHVDYIELAMKIDNNLLKEFISQIINYVEVRNGNISAICFKNGLIHRFKYRRDLDRICPKCGGKMLNTIGCRTRTIEYHGTRYRRIRVGDDKDQYKGKTTAKCSDCGASYGRWHHYGCSIETCPICGNKYTECEHFRN